MINANDWLSIWAVIILGVTVTIWIESRFRWATILGGPTIGLLMAASLSNLGVMPPVAPTYDVGSTFVLPVAICVLLLRADLRSIWIDAKQLLIPFIFAATGTIAGAIAAFALLPAVDERSRIAGVLTASYIGGTVNFAAVQEAVGLDKTLANGLLVADNLVMVTAFIALFALAHSSFLSSALENRDGSSPSSDSCAPASGINTKAVLSDLVASITIGTVVAAAATHLSPIIQSDLESVLPIALKRVGIHLILGNIYVVVTALALVIATLCPSYVGALKGSHELGVWFLYIYLFLLGLPAHIPTMLAHAPALMMFCSLVVIGNLTATLFGGWLFGLKREHVLLAINATVGGPSTAAAMAGACGWPRMVVPSLLIGLLGYALATPIGIAVAQALN